MISYISTDTAISFQIATGTISTIGAFRPAAAKSASTDSCWSRDINCWCNSLAALIPVIAVGSNGSPVQLRRKFYTKHDTMIPTLMMTLENWTATYCRFISGYGAVPATITRHDGCQSILPVNFVDAATFKLLNNSEGLGEFYNLLEIDTRDLTHPEFKTFDTIYAYKALDEGFNFRLDGFEVIGCDLPTYTQWEMQQHIIDSMKLDTDVVSFIIANIEDADRRHMIGDKMKKI